MKLYEELKLNVKNSFIKKPQDLIDEIINNMNGKIIPNKDYYFTYLQIIEEYGKETINVNDLEVLFDGTKDNVIETYTEYFYKLKGMFFKGINTNSSIYMKSYFYKHRNEMKKYYELICELADEHKYIIIKKYIINHQYETKIILRRLFSKEVYNCFKNEIELPEIFSDLSNNVFKLTKELTDKYFTDKVIEGVIDTIKDMNLSEFLNYKENIKKQISIPRANLKKIIKRDDEPNIFDNKMISTFSEETDKITNNKYINEFILQLKDILSSCYGKKVEE